MSTADRRNIVLTGFMGTGKTTVGRLLADELGYEFVDTDRVIEQRHGSIASIFAEQGEAAFRTIERNLAAELARRHGQVVSTGGRMMLDPANVEAFSRTGRVFCLVATPDAILERVTNDASRVERPLLAVPDPRQRIIELLDERTPLYRRFAQLTTEHVSPEAVAVDLAQLVRADPQRFAIVRPDSDDACDSTVGAALLPLVRELAAIEGPMVVVTNGESGRLHLASFGAVDLAVTLPAGVDRRDGVAAANHVRDALLDAGIDSSATIVSLGDSFVRDAAGLVAATYLGGLDLVHCPTDLGTMIDTGIGGTVGIDVPPGTDGVGVVRRPKAVIADVAMLQTLDARQFVAGLADVARLALIAESDLLEQLEAGEWRQPSPSERGALRRLESLVAGAIEVTIAIAQDAPFDESGRGIPDLGHPFAVAIERVGGDAVIRGEALGMGLVAAARLSERTGRAPVGLAARVESVVARVGLVTELPVELPVDALVEAISADDTRRPGQARLVLLRGLGDPVVTDGVEHGDLVAVLESLQPRRAG